MHLYGSPASPFVQRCAIVARAKGHDIAIEPVPGGAMRSPEFDAISPMGRVPVLALDDGTHICESFAVAGYLEETLAGPSLLPGTPLDRARIREIEAIAILELAAGLRPMMAFRVFRMAENEAAVAGGIAQADRGCAALARLMSDAPYAAGNSLTLADTALLPFVTLMRNIAHEPEVAALLAAHPLLRAYINVAMADPILARTVNEMTDSFAPVLARMREAAPA